MRTSTKSDRMIRTLKHYIKKIVGRPDPSWPLFMFEQSIHPDTWKNSASILARAEKCLEEKAMHEAPDLYAKSDSPLVRQGYALKQQVDRDFRNLFTNTSVRILIHLPDPNRSPAGYSLFKNFAEAFAFIGIPTTTFAWSDSTADVLRSFRPTVLLTSDHSTWLEKIDWGAVAEYRKHHSLHVGLTAGLAEYGNTPLLERLEWAKAHDISFYYSYRDPDYVHSRKEYQPFFDAGYQVLFLPFGANILHYYPVPDITPDLAYAFLASVNGSKFSRYTGYMLPILSTYPGFIDGPGWQHCKDFHFNAARDRYVYARSKVGLNVSLQEQIDWACEVNERTFMLAACGVPQVTDNAKLLPKLFSEDALFVAHNPQEYEAHAVSILENPSIGVRRALIAQRETFEKHTTFHRARSFVEQLLTHKII